MNLLKLLSGLFRIFLKIIINSFNFQTFEQMVGPNKRMSDLDF